MLTPAALQLIRQHPITAALNEDYEKARQIREVSGMSNLLLVRTRFIDERMLRALQKGATQVVILGAGFDTRAYRFDGHLKGQTVFEVDYQSTQEIKKCRLRELFGALPEHVRFIEIDFKKDALRDVLRHAGYRPDEKTFFIWEGVSMYLSEHAVRETLRMISSDSAPGSSVVMDFAERAVIDMLAKFPNLSQHNYTTHWGEPWIFGVPDMHEHEFFRECGFEVREILSFFGREVVKRYLTRADGIKLGNTRGGPPSYRAFSTTLRILWMLLTRRSHWCAIADLVVRIAQLAESTNLEDVVRARRQAIDGHGYFRAGKSSRCPCRGRAAAGRYRSVTHVVGPGARKRLHRNHQFTTIAVIDLEDRGRRQGWRRGTYREAASKPLDRNVGMSFLHMIST